MTVASARRAIPSAVPVRSSWWPPFLGLALLMVAEPSTTASAQSVDPVLEALRQHRQAVRTVEVLAALPAETRGHEPVALPIDLYEPRRVIATLPRLHLPALPALPVRDLVATSEEEDAPRSLDDMRWSKAAPGDEHPYMRRFAEVLWTNAGQLTTTPIDTMATPEVRARLNNLFGMPTRTAALRSRSDVRAGNPHVQFEYWLAVNDTIPVVVMDRSGPFGRGVLVVGEEEYIDVMPQIVENLARQLVASNRLMPYVDYYESQDRGQWYRTGYDGTRFYVLEIDRPAWVRRSDEGGHWFDFR